ncbi:glycosyltransferase family 2 protein [Flavobacterium sp. TMP13]|uniref:glycosyltransferase family 2 protein n=1 Tax=Flavobacterium sp. TMP13 TaxID=3425950 RepID=UPI003D76D350
MKKKISIITINYNNLEGLKRTVQSVVNQTWKEFEYIIIDGGSSDGSADYIESQNHYFDYWVSEKDSGIYNAMNKGIKVATGEYLLFLNSGDELYTKTVLYENNSQIHTEDLLYFDICQVFETTTNIYNFKDKINYRTFLNGTIGHPTTFIKKELFQKYGLYDEQLKIVSDWKFFFVVVAKFNASNRKVNNILSKFYMDGLSTTNKSQVSLERNNVLKSEFYDFVRLNDLEILLNSLNKSRTIKFLNKLGLLEYVKNYNTLK